MSNITIKVCSKCGAHMVRRENVMTTSYPAQYIYDCPECGNVEYDIKCYNGNLTTEDSMDYKAKYEEALERAKEKRNEYLRLDKDNVVPTDIEYIFPELRESEDERIRKEIVSVLKFANVEGVYDKHIAWLEKQKEPEYEPYKKEREIWVENTITDTFPKQDGDFISEEDYRNILRRTANHFYVMGEKQKEQKPAEPDWCHHKVDLSGCSEEYMKAYYDGWNNCNQQHAQCEAEQKPAEWGEKDKKMLRDVYESLYAYQCDLRGDENPDTELLDQVGKEKQWVKSLPERLNPQPKPEWSEEDEKIRKTLLDYYEKALDNYTCVEWLNGITYGELCDWLKSLRPQPKWKPSEDEERLINTSISFLKDFADKGYENAVECIDWLKSKLNGNTGK